MSRCTIGVDLGGTNIKSALFNEAFQAVQERSDPTEAAKGPSHVLHKIKQIVQEMLSQEGISQSSVKCIGMGIPGLLNPETGLSIFSPNFPEWENIHVVDMMKQDFDIPVFIDNDVRINLYGEWLYGAGAGYNNVFLITLGTGLGSGIVSDGRVLYGKTASAGEVGHMNMYRNGGRPCRCGSSGCLGRYASAVGMVRTMVEKMESGRESIIRTWVGGDFSQITALMISEAFDLGDALAIEVLHETGTILGFGLTNVVNLLNPEIVIIGGGMSAAGERLLKPVRDTIKHHALQLSSQACKVVPAQLGGRAGMIGAAAYAGFKVQQP
ncbi:ROK family protein [Paenibacillus thalictri]|uniref:ROK family protein n=1 Tax=Paenibacillus thalictri TaxID=2527873 RepID=A0A4Q9DHK2_9BACL|nr:ROK family protein [Paenibacillus thalictri]TBL69292.1 ROK family protein [Paenibacillus thalictri]